MKRLLAILCTLALMLSVINPAVFAAENSSLQAAKDDDSFEIIVLEEDTSNLTVNRDTYLDLNGHDLTGVSVTGGTLYIRDSATADYTVADGVYGQVTNVTGNVKAAEGYLQVGDSFHAVNLDIYAMTLRASDVGVYYKSNFAADEVVAEQVESFGVALSVVTAPNAENLDSYCGYSVFTGFEAGEDANATGTSTLLKGIMKAANGDEKNGKNAAMPVYGRAYIKTSDGYFFGETVKRSLQEQVEAIDGVWASLKDSQKAPVLGMLESYTAVMESWNIPNIQGIQVPGADTEIEIPIEVTAENGVVTEAVTVEQGAVSITVPAGVKLAEGAEALTLAVTPKETSDTGIQLEKNEVLMPMDVHVEGLAADNAQPLTICLGKIMPENLNMGNYTVYHVENGKANEMTLIPVDAEFTAHNQYKYSLDGELTLYMASFSEVAVVSDVNNAWEGKHDYTWYNADAETLYTRNADQLAGFGAIVGGMAEGIEQDDFTGKTVILLADISIGDTVADNGKVFYPIGYYNNQKSYTKTTGGSVTSSVSSFSGTFDGNGNTISDFYQNTWEMFGDYNDGYAGTPNHYDDAMGLFGYVLNGTVKNLTVKNFSSDGEFTPTGVIAAYAENSTFENIALTECNPRVYNTGNGGIIGIGGRTGDTSGQQLILKNITVDNTNKISALWGSWDVACGGLVGMFRGNADGGNGTISFENCHVAAQIDVYNDVCANYQYYAYRYSGMMIGSVRHNVKDANGHVYPNMAGISASGCTVHFGDWNDYYYCELVANTIASYTHDHQMSRLVQVASVDAANMQYVPLGETEPVAIPSEGRVNYVVVKTFDAGTQMWVHGDGHDYAQCYHFVDGAVWNHEDAGSHDNPFIDENGDDVADLKEDKQLIYREFNNLFTGYGWGVTSKGITDYNQDEIKILDRVEGSSVNKFVAADTFRGEKPYPSGAAIRLEDLFKATADGEAKETAILDANVKVTVSPVDENGTVKATYAANLADWTQGTLTFDKDFEGAALVTITDYYFCKPLTLTVNVTKYTADLYFEDLENKTAYCPVCEAVVTWTEIAGGDTTAQVKLTVSKKHYYLGASVNHTGEDPFISAANALSGWYTPGENDFACLHLNGKNITTTQDTAISASSAMLNVMGSGTVSGYYKAGTSTVAGAAIYCNVTGYSGINLYSGTYTQTDSTVNYAVSIFGNGGMLNIYKDAKIIGVGDKAVYVGAAEIRKAELYVEDAAIQGNIFVAAPKKKLNSNSANTASFAGAGKTYVTLKGANITGTVTLNAPAVPENGDELHVTLGGSLSINKIVIPDEVQATLDNMTEGAMIGVSATADVPFTVANENAAEYREYFYATADAQIVKAVNDQLVCVTPTYTDDLEFKANGKAYCAVCQAMATWTEITATTNKLQTGSQTNSHFYLKENVTCTDAGTGSFLSGPDTGKTACLHLNGKNLSATEQVVLFGSGGYVNVLGSGVVTGGTRGTGNGSTVAVNTYTKGMIKLYSGTFTDRKLSASTERYVVSINGNGGWIEICDDVVIESVNNKAIYVGKSGLRYSKLIVDGATVTGNVMVLSPLGATSNAYPGSNVQYNTAGQTDVTFNGTKINGTVTVNNVITSEEAAFEDHPAHQNFTLNGVVEISQLVLQNNAKVIIGELQEGAVVTFGNVSENAKYVMTIEGVEVEESLAGYSGQTIRYEDLVALLPTE